MSEVIVTEQLPAEPQPPSIYRRISQGLSRVLMACCLPGSVHFLSGKRLAGVVWYLIGFLITLLGIVALAMPGKLFLYIAFIPPAAYLVYFLLLFVSSYRQTYCFGWRGWLLFLPFCFCMNRLCTYFFVHHILFYFCAETFVITGMSMAPTLIAPSENYSDSPKISDRVIANKMIYRWSSPQRGDIAVYRTTTIDGKPTVLGKRIVGLPGETVDIQPPDILINGKRLTEPPFFKTMSEKDDGYSGYVRLEEMGLENAGVLLPITLGQDEYFLLGDNSERSVDSRMKGAVHRKDIIGKVVRLYYPFSRLRAL